MVLTDFDPSTSAVVNPQMLIPRIDDFPSVTVSVFSHELFDALLAFFEPRLLYNLKCASGPIPIYEVVYQGERFAFYHSLVGEPSCCGNYEELLAMGSQCLILLGNCGVLDKNIEDCGIIIPTAAIRDEGCSYHYAPASDTLAVNHKYTALFKEVLAAHSYPYVEGTTWTTDACYRETADKVAKRKAQGAVCVEMECAGMQALCDFRQTDFFQFFYAGDSLDHSTWQPRSLAGRVRLDDKSKIALLAFELGRRIKAEQGKD